MERINNIKIRHIYNFMLVAILFAIAGCSHGASNIQKDISMESAPTVSDIDNHSDISEKKSFGETVFGLMVPGYSSEIIFGRTKKEAELFEFVESELNKRDLKFITVLYLTADELPNINKKFDVAKKKECHINYITYKQNNDSEKTFVLYYNMDGLLEINVLNFDDELNEWRLERQRGQGTDRGQP